VPHAFFFLASLAWNFALGMTWLAIPLNAAAQGLSNAQIGVLISVPVLLQAPLNLAGGAYTDRIGGRRIVLASCFMTALAGLWLVYAQGFWMLFAGQSIVILARAAFWPATWAMASELPGGRSVQLGRLNAATNVGQICGAAASGVLLAAVGFGATFAVLAGVGVVAFLCSLGTRVPAHARAAGSAHPLSAFKPLLRQPIIHYSIMCAYLSALPFSLSLSFYPLLLAQFGHSEETSGVLLALRALGSICAGLIAARFVRTGPETLWPVGCGVAVAAAVGLFPLVNHTAMLAFWMVVMGLATGAMTLYFQITISEASRPDQRGSALALGGMGWSVSHLSTPLLMGFLADRFGIVAGFYVLGGLALVCAVAVGFLRRWAFRSLPALVTPP
jgi:MFS family permease